ncbi:MAG: Peptidoglycan D,D-transpeptidase MrdA [Holosporales bacterium]
MDDLLETRFQRRTLILGAAKGTLLLGLMGRLFQLQILDQKHYEGLSDKNRFHSFLVIPERGLIADRNNVILANLRTEYYCVFEPNVEGTKLVDLIPTLKKIINLNDLDLKVIQKQLSRKRLLDPIMIKENMTLEEMARLQVHLFELPGVRCDKAKSRLYPDPYPFSHLLGFVGIPSQKEKDDDPLFLLPEFRVGKTGLEKQFDSTLRGVAGTKTVEVNAYRKIQRVISHQKGVKGHDLHLTIDATLQKKVYDILSPHLSASCVVMHAHTGAVHAFVSYPGFDTNLFLHRIYKKDWDALSNDPHHPLTNKLIQGTYAPGSTFKMIVALAALKKGIINEQTTFSCCGEFDFKNHTYHCWNWKNGGHGSVNLERALAQSCDVYFYQLALKLSVDDIAEMANAFGLGSLTGIEIPNERKGLIPTKKWHLEKRKSKWLTGDNINLSIGQGKILTTPMQLCRMMAGLCNGGKLVTPHLIKLDHPMAESIDVDANHLKLIQKGMSSVVNQPYGTAYQARIVNEKYAMIGKTGSTQVARITKQQRADGTINQNPWHLKEHALFVGGAPLNDPQFVIAVLVEHGGSGGRISAPIARDILHATQEILKC